MHGQFTIRLRLPCPPDSGVTSWGDYHFAMSLTKALRKLGHRVIVDFATQRGKGKSRRAWVLRRLWTRIRTVIWQRPDFDLILRGNVHYAPVSDRPCLIWLISNSQSVSGQEVSEAAHVFVASNLHAKALISAGHKNVSVLLQCTDPDLFRPDRATDELGCEALFVGNKRNFDRASVTFAIQAGLPVQIWGRGWEGLVPDDRIGGIHIGNSDLGKYYSSARYVLNDHAPDMQADGFASNRVFDVLASGVALVSDPVPDLPPELARFVFQFDSYSSFLLACERAVHETAEQRKERLALAEVVRREHSFDARAKEIIRKAEAILNGR
jgi:hypothetical protein